MLSIWGIIKSVLAGFVDLLLLPYHIYQWFQLETLKEKMSALTLAGNSSEFLCIVIALMLVIVIIGLLRHDFLKATVRSLELFNGRIGQFASWFVLLMMIQQVLIISVGQVFRGNFILLSPLGVDIIGEGLQLQWLSGQLKLYNAILIAMASAYTFIEGGHVRVDLIYATLTYRTRKIIDLVGTLIFLFPSTFMLWWFAWPLATNSMFSQRPMNIWSEKASWRGFKWESSGTAEFSWVWAFKLLILVFAGLMTIQALAFLLRNILALREPREIPAHPKFDGERDKTTPEAAIHSA
jgi:TRAP-type mannitol/chloroaromatic compound transport system permease small subunit